MVHYETEAQIRAVVEGFESCQTDKDVFTHQDHLTVACCYVRELSLENAIRKMRDGLYRFISHHQIDSKKYNETITVFWLELVSKAVQQMPESDLVEQCNQIAETFDNSALAMEHYSRDLLFSERAREVFVEPDLKKY